MDHTWTCSKNLNLSMYMVFEPGVLVYSLLIAACFSITDHILNTFTQSAASIVNDILDGSFNRSSEPSSLKDLSSSDVPVQAADSREADNAVAFHSHTFHIQAKEREAEKQPTTIPARLSNSVPEEERNGFQAFQSKSPSTAEDANQNAIGGGLIVVEVPQILDTENIVVPPVISLVSLNVYFKKDF